MSVNLSGFDANQIEPSTGGKDIVPTGDYRVAIIATARKETSTKGQFGMTVDMTILDGAHQGKVLSTFLNLWHLKQEVKEIAQRELSAICRATGVITPSVSEDLHNIPLVVRVEHFPKGSIISSGAKKGQQRQYEENNITKFSPDTGIPSTSAPAFGAPAAAQPAAPAAAPFTPQGAPAPAPSWV